MRTVHSTLMRHTIASLAMVLVHVQTNLAVPPPEIFAELYSNHIPTDTIAPATFPDTCIPSVFTFNNVSLDKQLNRCTFGSDSGTNPNDVWAYVSPSGRRYAIVALSNRVAFVEVTDPSNPVFIDDILGGASRWRDMKVHENYCYVVRQESGLGIQIIDMSNIDNGEIVVANETMLGGFFSTAHNIAYNPESEFFYLCIPNTNGGIGLVVVDPTNDPTNPVIAGAWNTGPGVRCHDAFVVNYHQGPYAGREIAFCFAENDGLIIGDVTNKSNMFTIGSLNNSSWRYTHQGWISADRRHLFVGDELDESDSQLGISSTRTYVVNIENLSNPFLTSFYSAAITNHAIDHNMMTRGRYLFQANYTSGLRILDVSNVANITEAGFFDTFDTSDGTLFKGAWGVYAGFGDGMVLITDMVNGLFVLDASALLDVPSIPTTPLFPQGTIKNRYISFINSLGTEPGNYQVRRFRKNLPPEVVGWVGPPDIHGMSEIVPWPPNPSIVWPNIVIEAGDCEILPATTYQIFATTDNWFFAEPFTILTSGNPNGLPAWGDVTGNLVNGSTWLPADGIVDASDILAVLQGVTMNPLSANIDRLDLSPEIPDGLVDDGDLQSVVDAFENQPYPFADATLCASP